MENSSKLKRLGYNQFFDNHRSKLGASIDQVARITAEHRGAYEIICNAGEYRATVTGRQMLLASTRDDYPAVGDWVIINQSEDEYKLIIDILPRKTTLHKKYAGKDENQLIAANVDIAFIVESFDRDYSLNRFERYLVLAREGGIVPVIIINKVDLLSLDNKIDKIVEAIRDRFKKVDVLTTSTVAVSGIHQLISYMEEGTTYCFLGSSGVGKSSLINKLLKQDRIATKTIGEKTGRGRHTTTAREMYFTSRGRVIIDNPGSREVGVADSITGIGKVFTDIEDIASTCKFKDCKHVNEPGCAVQDAINTGIINPSKYENYQKLLKETEHYDMSTHSKRQKDKKFGRYIKNAKIELEKFSDLDL